MFGGTQDTVGSMGDVPSCNCACTNSCMLPRACSCARVHNICFHSAEVCFWLRHRPAHPLLAPPSFTCLKQLLLSAKCVKCTTLQLTGSWRLHPSPAEGNSSCPYCVLGAQPSSSPALGASIIMEAAPFFSCLKQLLLSIHCVGCTTLQLTQRRPPPACANCFLHPGGDIPGTTTIQLTPEEAEAIGRLEALGFDRTSCLVGLCWAWSCSCMKQTQSRVIVCAGYGPAHV